MSEAQTSYRQIMKGTSIFGGVQVFNILVGIIKSKIIAVLLGPAGMGISGLYTSTTSLVSGLTNFGLGTSAVRNISEANAEGNKERIAKVITVLRRLVWITGMLGLIAVLILAPWLSQLTFGSKDYTIAFRWLSITLLLDQLASGQRVLLQGMRQLKYLAKANVIGSFLGLLISVPLYYYYRVDGIVPALIASSAIAMLIAWYFSGKIKIEPVTVNKKETIAEGKSMLTLGFALSLSGLITVAASYIIRAFISRTGSLDDVGLYSAGFAIIGSYAGMVFSAMGTDYYPRLAGVAKDNKQANQLIQQQAEVALLILGPILCVFIVFAHWAVVLLYSSQFVLINDMIRWAALGMYFKAISWAIGYVFLAKGNSKLFFLNEILANTYILLLNIIGYKLHGLTGLGISFLLAYFLFFLQVYLITKKNYSFTYSHSFYKLILIQLIFGIACFLIISFFSTILAYIIGVLLIVAVSWYSLKELDKRMNLWEILSNLKSK